MPKSQETRNSKTGLGKRCQLRSFELVYETLSPNKRPLLNELCDKKHGVLYAFAVKHTLPDTTSHVHVGVILRDKPQDRSFTWENLRQYFTVNGSNRPRQVGKLLCPKRDFGLKLQQYYDYCTDQSKHPDQVLEVLFIHKWKPLSEEDSLKPADLLCRKVRSGMTVEELEDLIDNDATAPNVFKEALKNYDIYARMIEKLAEIRSAKLLRATYAKVAATYRPFQRGLCKVLDEQNERNIHGHYDPGNTGKNFLIDNESKRKDTLILQSAETKRIAYVWNPLIHKRIIFDIPKGKMQFVNTSVIEKLKNGTLLSTMHHPKMKKSVFKPSILILGNEELPANWTEDRLTQSTTNRNHYQLITL